MWNLILVAISVNPNFVQGLRHSDRREAGAECLCDARLLAEICSGLWICLSHESIWCGSLAFSKHSGLSLLFGFIVNFHCLMRPGLVLFLHLKEPNRQLENHNWEYDWYKSTCLNLIDAVSKADKSSDSESWWFFASTAQLSLLCIN